jgi:hypothetical protein
MQSEVSVLYFYLRKHPHMSPVPYQTADSTLSTSCFKYLPSIVCVHLSMISDLSDNETTVEYLCSLRLSLEHTSNTDASLIPL